MSNLPELLKWLNEKLDIEIQEYPLGDESLLDAYSLNLSRFRLKLGEDTPCLYVWGGLSKEQPPGQIRRLIVDCVRSQGWQRKAVIVLFDGDAEELKLLCRDDLVRLVILDTDSQEHAMSVTNSNNLIEEISKQLPISALSLYETAMPVSGEAFFGREAELRSIRQSPNTNFLITGNRRMGKSSLLLEARRRLRQESSSDLSLYLDCSIYGDSQDFYADVIRELDGPREVERLYKDITFSFWAFLRRMSRSKKVRVVFFLDEIDRLLELDAKNSWVLFQGLRGLSASRNSYDNESFVRVLMAGFRYATSVADRLDSPLFNFASNIRISNFDLRSTEQIVVEPMFNLGLRFVDRSMLVNRIYRETGGNPNLIQHYCQYIVRRLEMIGERTVTNSILDGATSDDSLRQRLAIGWIRNASNLEQLIVFLFIQNNKDISSDSTLPDISRWLHECGAELMRSDIEYALDNLVVSGILTREAKVYRFAFYLLPMILVENWDIQYQIKAVLQEGI